MTGIGVASLTALAGLAITQKGLYWVEDQKSWYWGNPTGADVADGNLIVAPTSGSGRYYKQYSVNPVNGLTWLTVSSAGNFVATPNYGYVLDFSGFAGGLTITLPAAPAIGSRIEFRYMSASNITKILTINPNGAAINGVVSSLYIFQQFARVTLEYCGANGWIFAGNTQAASGLTGTLTSFAKPAATTNSQRGIFDFFGKRRNAGNAYSNPINAVLSNGDCLFVGSDSGFVGGTAPNMISQSATPAQIYVMYSTGDLGSGIFFLPMNTNNFNTQYRIRPQDIYLEWQTTGETPTAKGINYIQIWGSNSFNESSSILVNKPSWLYANRFANTAKQYPGISASVPWTLLATFDVNNFIYTNGYIRAVASAHYLNVAASDAYTALRMTFSTGTLGNASYLLEEIEIFGDIFS